MTQDSSAAIDYRTRAFWMAQKVLHLVSDLSIVAGVAESGVDVITESPNNWFTSKGQTSKDNEAVQKLYYQVGLIIGMLSACPLVKYIGSAIPIEWKGTTPKPIMVQRALEYAGSVGTMLPPNTKHDLMEALLLGVWARKLRVKESEGPGRYAMPITPSYVAGHILPGCKLSISTHVDYE